MLINSCIKGGPVFSQGWIHYANIKIFHGVWHILSSLNSHYPGWTLWIPRFSLTIVLPRPLLIPPTMRLSWLWEKGCSDSSSVKERQLDKWYQHRVKAYCHQNGHQSRAMTCNLKISFEMRNLDTSGAKFNQLSLSL